MLFTLREAALLCFERREFIVVVVCPKRLLLISGVIFGQANGQPSGGYLKTLAGFATAQDDGGYVTCNYHTIMAGFEAARARWRLGYVSIANQQPRKDGHNTHLRFRSGLWHGW